MNAGWGFFSLHHLIPHLGFWLESVIQEFSNVPTIPNPAEVYSSKAKEQFHKRFE